METTLLGGTLRTEARGVEAALARRLASHDTVRLRSRYVHDGSFIVIEDFLDEELLANMRQQCDTIADRAHRRSLPGHKRGGAIEWKAVEQHVPTVGVLYTSPQLRAFVGAIVGEPVVLCPARDPHRCALYVYTRPGDQIGFHYDRSYYRGRRYTLLLGVVDTSSQRLRCRLHTRDEGGRPTEVVVRTAPGTLVLFDGDRVQHAVTPMRANERRIVITMEYVSDPRMRPWWRLISDFKDALGYFGFAALLRARGER